MWKETPDTVARRLQVATAVAQEAGRVAHDFFTAPGRFTVEAKGVRDITTTADREVEELIVSRLGTSFSGDGFWGEERGGSVGLGGAARSLWVIDPIDGTRNFTKGVEFWCVSIAFVADGTVEIGVVYDPIRDELFAARRGHGVTLDGKAISVSDASKLAGCRLASDSHPAVADRWRGVRRRLQDAGAETSCLGAGALAATHVACGRLDAYWNLYTHSWDVLAAGILVREAGGKTNDFPASGDLGQCRPFLASAPRIAAPLRELTLQA